MRKLILGLLVVIGLSISDANAASVSYPNMPVACLPDRAQQDEMAACHCPPVEMCDEMPGFMVERCCQEKEVARVCPAANIAMPNTCPGGITPDVNGNCCAYSERKYERFKHWHVRWREDPELSVVRFPSYLVGNRVHNNNNNWNRPWLPAMRPWGYGILDIENGDIYTYMNYETGYFESWPDFLGMSEDDPNVEKEVQEFKDWVQDNRDIYARAGWKISDRGVLMSHQAAEINKTGNALGRPYSFKKYRVGDAEFEKFPHRCWYREDGNSELLKDYNDGNMVPIRGAISDDRVFNCGQTMAKICPLTAEKGNIRHNQPTTVGSQVCSITNLDGSKPNFGLHSWGGYDAEGYLKGSIDISVKNCCVYEIPGETSCLAPDTLVTMADGSEKMIQKIVKGDVVKGKTSNNVVQEVVILTLDNRDMYSLNDGVLKLTAEHPIMTAEGWKSVNGDAEKAKLKYNLDSVGILKLGDEIITKDGKIKLEKMEKLPLEENTTTFNLKLDGDETFYAGGVLVKDN